MTKNNIPLVVKMSHCFKIFCIFILVGIVVAIVSLNFYWSPEQNSVSGSSDGIRYDPEIYEKSGGMAAYSTSPMDTSPEGGGYINYPYHIPVPWWFNVPRYWGIYIKRYPYYIEPLRQHFMTYRKTGYFPQSLLVPNNWLYTNNRRRHRGRHRRKHRRRHRGDS